MWFLLRFFRPFGAWISWAFNPAMNRWAIFCRPCRTLALLIRRPSAEALGYYRPVPPGRLRSCASGVSGWPIRLPNCPALSTQCPRLLPNCPSFPPNRPPLAPNRSGLLPSRASFLPLRPPRLPRRVSFFTNRPSPEPNHPPRLPNRPALGQCLTRHDFRVLFRDTECVERSSHRAGIARHSGNASFRAKGTLSYQPGATPQVIVPQTAKG